MPNISPSTTWQCQSQCTQHAQHLTPRVQECLCLASVKESSATCTSESMQNCAEPRTERDNHSWTDPTCSFQISGCQEELLSPIHLSTTYTPEAPQSRSVCHSMEDWGKPKVHLLEQPSLHKINMYTCKGRMHSRGRHSSVGRSCLHGCCSRGVAEPAE